MKLNWKSGIYYGEVFGFLFAWAVCLVIAFSHTRQQDEQPETKTVAAADAAPGRID